MSVTPKAKLLCLAACLLWAFPLCAEQPPRAELITANRIGTTPPMANYLATHHPAPNAPVRVFPVRKPGSHPGKGNGGTNGGGSSNTWSDPVLQTDQTLLGSTPNYSTLTGIEGISSVGYVPPDTNISVGDTQVVETVNVDYAVYDKTSGSPPVLGPTPIHAIFAAAGGSSVCSSVDGGDPIVLYDKIDKAWIISQLAYNVSFTQNHLCLAISTGPNKSDAAQASYAAYDISFGKVLPDYPKLGIWTNGSTLNNSSNQAGVYFSANMFSHGSSFIGAQVCGFPLSEVATPPTTKLNWVCHQFGTSVYSLLPADLEGSPGVSGTTTPAPAGTAEYFMQFSGSNTLSLYQFDPGFASGSPTVSGPMNVSNVATFREACGGGSCVPQLGTSTQLDSLGDRLMYRLSYRNYGGTLGQSMVVTQSVQDASTSSQAGIRWYQLTNPYSSGGSATTGSGWQIRQQGTFGPNDGDYRWMGSIAQDKVGDLGLGYSVSSSLINPTIAVTGQTPTDAQSTAAKYPLLEKETSAIAQGLAVGYQSSVSRWGDYSSMSVDPSDDCTMWYANEYLISNGSYTNWGTYITSFKFTNNCK